MNLNRFELQMSSLRPDHCYTPLESVLKPLGSAICGAEESLNDERLNGLDPFHVEALIDEQTWIIENLLGAGYLVCQTHISMVVSRVMKLHDVVSKSRHQLTCCQKKKTSILQLGSPRLTDLSYSVVQVIDAAANYFKHRSEWGTRWSQLKGGSRATADIIEAVGALPGSSGNLRTISGALGNKQYKETTVFARAVMGWHIAVERALESDLISLGLIDARS